MFIEDRLSVINTEKMLGDTGITKLSDYYRKDNPATQTTSIIFCQHCGAENIIMPGRNKTDIIYCVKCGEVI